MKTSLALFLLCAPAFAAVNGTVVNGTSGKPEAGVTVTLDKLTQAGMETAGETKSDPLGGFAINQELQGPYLLRASYQGVTYNMVLTPGTPSTGLTFNVYDSSRSPGDAKIAQHMILFEPGDGKLGISETYIFNNAGKVTWNDPDAGTLKFWLPAAAKGEAQVNATAPGGMPVPQTPEKIGRGDVYKISFPVKPGETRIDVTYLVPYTAGAAYEGKVATKDEATRLVSPNPVTLAGDNVKDIGLEPSTQAHIYDLKATAYKISITGTGTLRGQNAPAADAGDQQQEGGPAMEEIMPRVNGKAVPILAIALGILALGFVLLYRAPVPAGEETNERRRR